MWASVTCNIQSTSKIEEMKFKIIKFIESLDMRHPSFLANHISSCLPYICIEELSGNYLQSQINFFFYVLCSVLVNLENSAAAIGVEKVNFNSNPKKWQSQKCSNYHTITLISYADKVMLKILQVRLQQSVNKNVQMYKLGLEKVEESKIKLPTFFGYRENKEIPEKKIYFCFIDYAKAFDCVDHNKLENSSRDGNTRPLYLSPKKLVCRSKSNSQNQTRNNGLVQN